MLFHVDLEGLTQALELVVGRAGVALVELSEEALKDCGERLVDYGVLHECELEVRDALLTDHVDKVN